MTTEQRLTPAEEVRIRQDHETIGELYVSGFGNRDTTKTLWLALKSVLAELDAVRRELAEAQKDSARLDWMGAKIDDYPMMRIVGGATPHIQYFTPLRECLNAPPGETLREAIDAAMAQDGG